MLKIFLWGTGAVAKQILRESDCFSQYDVIGFIDNDKNKVNTSFCGREVFFTDIFSELVPDKIIVLTDYFEEIKEQIRKIFPKLIDRVENKNYFFKQRLLIRYKNCQDLEIKSLINYVENNGLQVFNYDFVKKYEKLKIEIYFDIDCGMYFVYHKGKKMYFARFLNTMEKVRRYYKNILMEQDEKSPHRYLDSQFDVKKGDIVVDTGVAEGNFSLDIIDKVSKLYMIEADARWVEALEKTFEGYQDKVIFFNNYISSIDDGQYATLDNLITEPIDFIKMDIEGGEWDALLGAEQVIERSPKLKCAICSYHGDFDEILIKHVLKKYKMDCSTTEGYMWFPEKIRQTYVSSRLCRGIVRAEKNNFNICEKIS